MAEPAAGDKGAVVFSDRPEPKPAVMNTGSIVNARGQKLFTSSWLPFQGDAKAILLYHHGLSEHSSRYEHAFAKLAAAGIAVYSYDAFSQGKSEPKETQLRSYIDDFQHLLDDYMLVLKSIKDEYEKQSKPLPPVFAGGGSLGGLVVALVAVKHPNEFAGLVMQSPCVDVEWTPFLRMQAKMGGYLNYFFPKAALVPAVRPEDMSQDPQVVKEYLDDPLIYTGKVKVRTAHLTLQAMGQLQKEIPKLTLPLYICHGTLDRCTSCPASKRLFEAAPTKDKVFHAIEGGYHELLFGPEKADCLDKMITWLLDHYPGATPVAATFPAPVAPTTTPAAAAPTTTTPAAAPAAASTTTTTPAAVPAAADAASVPAAAVTGATPGADSSAAIAATAAAIERATSQAIEGMKTTEADAPKA